jgi:hypothetical protein
MKNKIREISIECPENTIEVVWGSKIFPQKKKIKLKTKDFDNFSNLFFDEKISEKDLGNIFLLEKDSKVIKNKLIELINAKI